MATTWLEIGPSSSTFVTIQYPQTYSGPSLPGLTWPWVYRPTDASEGTAVSIIGGPAGLVTVGRSFATSGTLRRKLYKLLHNSKGPAHMS